MKLSELVLNERIYSSEGDLIISIQHDRETSTGEAISTFARRNPYQTNLVGAGESIIYSILNYISSPETTKLLQSIKGRGPYRIKDAQLDVFLEQIAKYTVGIFQRLRPETIIVPKSSSEFLHKFVEKLKKGYPKASYFSDAFVKKILNAEDVEPLINKQHPDWDKFERDFPKDAEDLRKSLKRQIQATGGLELKKLYKPHLKFIKNFIELQNAYEVLDHVLDKRVMVLDDVLSSGSTMVEMLRQLHELEPKFLAGLTIFKRTNKLKE